MKFVQKDDGSADIISCGWLLGDFDDSIGTAVRRATERPFFRPISLDPRLARLAVNLACGPIDQYAVLDPMTGTGGFAMEAILMGRNCIAVDMNDEMITGAKSNIKWALQGKNTNSDYEIINGDACQLSSFVDKKWHGNISAIVLDPPYGRNSQSSYKHIELLRNTLQSARKLVNQSAKMVLIIPIKPNQENQTEYQLLHDDWQTYLELFADLGIKLLGQWKEHVHSSLSRLILLASISPLNLTD